MEGEGVAMSSSSNEVDGEVTAAADPGVQQLFLTLASGSIDDLFTLQREGEWCVRVCVCVCVCAPSVSLHNCILSLQHANTSQEI
jgi:hypothetical protein